MRHTIGNSDKYSDVDRNCDSDRYGDVNCYGYSVGDTDQYLYTRRQRNTRAVDDWNDRTALEISSWRNN